MAKQAEAVGQEQQGQQEQDGEVLSQLNDLENLAKSTAQDFKPESADLTGPEVPAGPSMESAQMCGQLVEVVFGVIATRRGNHWALKAEEAGMMGGALAGVLDKYAPDMKTGPEAALVVVGLLIVGPRLAVDAAARKALEKEQGGKDGDSGKSKPTQ